MLETRPTPVGYPVRVQDYTHDPAGRPATVAMLGEADRDDTPAGLQWQCILIHRQHDRFGPRLRGGSPPSN